MAISYEEYSQFDATDLAELVRSGEVCPEELLDAAMQGVSLLNPKLNAVSHLFEASAKQAIESGLSKGPFYGVPILLKDLFINLAGELTNNGSVYWKDFRPKKNSELVNRYLKAGFCIFGKTASAELGLSATTETEAFGVTCNPWNLEKTAGGSSGGAGSAVAARIVPIAQASDSGGSIRIPASCCGVFGLKPSRGRMPVGPERGEITSGLGTYHAITLSVRDSAALLDATAGCDIGAPYGIASPKQQWKYQTRSDVFETSRRLRIGLNLESPTSTGIIDADCASAAEFAAHACEALGHHVEVVNMPIDYKSLNEVIPILMATLASSQVNEYEHDLGRSPHIKELQNVTRSLIDLAKTFSSTDYVSAIATYQKAGRSLAEFQIDYDLILSPTLANVPLNHGELSPVTLSLDEYSRKFSEFTPFTLIANMAGVPAMSVPLFWNSEGLPIGVQFIGRFGEEALMLRLAAELESAFPWKCTRPVLTQK